MPWGTFLSMAGRFKATPAHGWLLLTEPLTCHAPVIGPFAVPFTKSWPGGPMP
jgi:hypothetical protein